MNIPRDLVQNEERWKQAQLKSSSEDEKVVYTSPLTKRLSTAKRTLEALESKVLKKPRWYNY